MGSILPIADQEQRRSQSQPTKIRKIPTEKELSAILQTFNTWAFKREQPSDLPLLRRCIARAVMKAEKLSFVMYWGKGPRSQIAGPDLQCLEYLASLAARVKTAYSRGVNFELVLTDTHASLNGHSTTAVTSYFADVEHEAMARGFSCYLLSEISRASASHIALETCKAPSDDVLQRLVSSAERWYRGDGHALDGARKYYQMNMVERQAIEHFFPASVFATFNGSEQRDLFPQNLPIFYMYSMRR